MYPAGPAAAAAPLCVCIHGLGVDANVWQFIAPRLQARGISVLCLDLRGHGLSDRGSWLSFNPRQMAADVVAACLNLGLQPSFFLAQSFGTIVGLEILRRYDPGPDVPSLFAVTPVWTGERKSLSSIPNMAANTFRYLRQLGRLVGYRAPRTPGRRDHTRYASFPDSHMPRFAEEAAAISWAGYARLLIGLRLQAYGFDPHWERLSGYAVHMIAATRDGLWNNRELEVVRRKTGWPLHWIEMRHVSLATDEQYADALIEILERESG